MVRAFVLIMAVTYANTAVAGFVDGNTLNLSCDRGDLVSLGYVGGVLDKRNAEISFLGNEIENTKGDALRYQIALDLRHASGGYCISDSQLGQFNKVFCKFLADNPQLLHLGGEELVTLAFSEAFPCKK